MHGAVSLNNWPRSRFILCAHKFYTSLDQLLELFTSKKNVPQTCIESDCETTVELKPDYSKQRVIKIDKELIANEAYINR